MRVRDSVSWNSPIASSAASSSNADEALLQSRWMLRSASSRGARVSCDHATFTTVLSVCARAASLPACAMVHGLVVSRRFEGEVSVGNALVTGYFECGSSGFAKKAFYGMAERNVITWTAMISGMARAELYEDSILLFRQMRRTVDANNATYSSSLLACAGSLAAKEGKQIHGLIVKDGLATDLHVESGLMDVYSKCGLMEDALSVFRACRQPDEVFLTVILVGFAQNGLEEKAFELFAEMAGEGICIDTNMVSAVLGAFGASVPFALGKQIHALVIKKCFGRNIYVCNGLINMYSKCGELQESVQVFDETPGNNSISWNSIIAAFARHGQGSGVFQLFESMKAIGASPMDVTFLSLLHGCSHVGSAKKGFYVIALEDAKSFIEDGPFKDSAILWQALMGACSFHRNLDIGKYAAEKLLLVDPESPASYVLLSNIYSAEGRWNDRAKVMKNMR
ncbi:hypothetical protein ZWY2020_048674 [Hordeum vulgare]|nr:hypothetical protein ZWY2020_048674 [Hordeum vulgare]